MLFYVPSRTSKAHDRFKDWGVAKRVFRVFERRNDFKRLLIAIYSGEQEDNCCKHTCDSLAGI